MPPLCLRKKEHKEVGKWGERKDWREREEEGGEASYQVGEGKDAETTRRGRRRRAFQTLEVGSGRPPRDGEETKEEEEGSGCGRGREKHKNNLGHLKRFSCRPAVRKGNCR